MRERTMGDWPRYSFLGLALGLPVSGDSLKSRETAVMRLFLAKH
jgi:hypothetical protein